MGEYLRKKIKNVIFKNADDNYLKWIVINKYNNIEETKYKIKVLQDELEMLEENWDEIKDLFTLEFEE